MLEYWSAGVLECQKAYRTTGFQARRFKLKTPFQCCWQTSRVVSFAAIENMLTSDRNRRAWKPIVREKYATLGSIQPAIAHTRDRQLAHLTSIVKAAAAAGETGEDSNDGVDSACISADLG